jgi:hypothetical protein
MYCENVIVYQKSVSSLEILRSEDLGSTLLKNGG